MKAEIIEKKNGSRRQTEDARNIVLDRPSVVFLKLAPENVARYERRGDDLVLVMKDGQELLIQGFFIKFAGDDAIDSDARTDVADNGSTEELTRSELVLEDENGVVWWGQYPEQWTEFHFAEIEWDDAAAAVWWPYLLGALGAAGAGVAIAGGSKKNKPPVAINDEGRGEEDGGPVTGNVIGNDNDPDGDPLTVTDFTVEGTTYKPGETAEIPGVGTIVINTDGSYTFTPEPDYNGTVPTITYTISDGKGGSDKADLVITIDPVNDAPVPEGEIEDQSSKDADTDTDLDASGFFTDVDGDDLTYSATGLPEGLTIDPVTGKISGTIDKSASQGGHDGVYSVTITATDPDGESATQTFTWTVTNPEPIAEDDTATTAEDTEVSGNVLGNDSDPDGDTLNVTEFTIEGVTGKFDAGSTATIPGVGTIVINSNGSYTFEPAQDWNGTVPTIAYTISDGEGGTDTADLDITVTPVNDAPVPVGSIGDQEDADADTITELDTSAFFKDVDGDDLTYSATGLPEGLTIDPDTGKITGTIDKSASQGGAGGVYRDGVYNVTITVVDPDGERTSQSFTWTVTNPEPTAEDDTATTAEDTPVSGNVLGGTGAGVGDVADVDPDGDTLSVTEFTIEGVTGKFDAGSTATIPGVGTIVINSNGSYTFEPAQDWNGTVPTITYTVSDGEGGTDTADLDITVTPVNDAPVPVGSIGDQEDADADTITELDTSAFFKDVDGDDLTYSATGLPAGLTIDPDTGKITGTIDKSASQNGTGGVHNVTITVKDPSGETTDQTFTWTVTNPEPIAEDDTATTAEDTAVSGNVLGGTGAGVGDVADVDPDGDTLSVTEFTIEGVTGKFDAGSTATIPGVGTIVINSNGSYTFEPAQDWNGTVPTITYTISDGEGGTDTADLNITVTPVNDAPVPVGSIGDQEDADADTITELDTSAFFKDVDGDDLTYSATGLPEGLTIDPDTGKITGTIDKSASQNGTGGVHNVTITVKDPSGETTDQTFTWTVTNPEPIAEDDTATTAEDTEVSGNVLGNDSDPDGDTLNVTEFTIEGVTGKFDAGSTATIPGVGTIVINSNGSYTFEPAQDWNGTVPTIAYTISDGEGGTDTADLDITVTPVNDAPVPVGSIGDQEDADADTITELDTSAFFKDVDGDDLTYSATGLPEGLTIDPVTGKITGTIDKSASQGGAGGVYRDGVYNVTITVVDPDGERTSQSFTWTVTNPEPTAEDDTATTAEDTPVSGNVLGGTGAGVGDVADVDPDGDTLSVTEFTIEGVTGKFDAGSTATIPGVGTILINTDGSYTFTPAQDWNGTVPTITYTISDGEGGTDTADLDITVTPVNDAPVPVGSIGDQEDADADTITELDTSAFFKDVDGDDLTYSATGLPEGLTIDPDTGKITGTIDKSASQNGTGGVHNVTITVKDPSGETTDQTFTWTVTNPEPTANNDAATTAEDTPVSGNVLGNDIDPDGDPLSVTEFTIEGVTGKFDAGSTATIPGVGTIVINSNGSYTFEPAQDWNGTVPTITYTISDGEGGTDTADLDITVTPVNDAPVINGGAQTGTVVEAGHLDDGTVVDGTPAVSGNFTATDVDGDVLTWSVTGTPDTTYGKFTIAADGSWSYELDNDLPATQALKEGDTKDLIFTVQVSDGNGGVKTETVTITITGTNDAPVANADSDTVKESGVSGGGNDAEAGKPTATGNVLTNDTDVDAGEQATLQVSGVEFDGSPGAVGSALSGTYGSLVLNANGTYTYTLDNGSAATQALKQGETKTEVFTYTVTDVNGATSETTLTITVTGTNDRPEITSDANDATGSVTEMGTGVAGTPTATGTLTATDVDSDATQTWRIEGGTNGTYGTITIDADGNWTYILDNTREATQKLNNGDVREEIFTARVKDEFGAYSDQLITITVNGSNDKLEGENATVTVTEDVPHEGTLQDYFDDVDDELIVTQFTIEGDPTVYTPGVPVEIKDADNNPIGTVTINADGTYIFTPEPNYAGDVPTITYTMKEDRTGGESIEQTLTFDMVKVADAPDLDADKTVDTMEDVSKALGLKIPTITDTGAGGVVTNDFPERIGEITLTIGGVGADGVTLLNGTEVLTPVDGKITIVLVDGSNQPLDIHVNDVPAEGDGVYYLTEAEYEALQVNPKAESGDNFTVTVDVTSYEVDGNGVKIPGVAGASSSQVIDVDVQAVTDGATLEIDQTDFTGNEDTAIDLSPFLKPTLTDGDGDGGFDTDGSEQYSYDVSGLPIGSIVTIDGVEFEITAENPIASSEWGSWTAVPEITIKPPLNFSGDMEEVTITLNSRDTDTDSEGTIETKSSSVTIDLYVNPVAGDVEVANVITDEDMAVAFLAGVTVTDADGSEVINSISFDVPAGWELSTIPTVAGMTVTGGSTGSVTIEFADNMSQEAREAALDQFMIKPPAHKSADAEIDLTIKVTDSKIVNGTLVTDTETITDKSVTIIVDAVAEKVGDDSNGDSHDDVTMSGDHVYNVSGKEDTWFALGTNYTDATNTGGGFAGLGGAGVWTNEDPSEFTYAVLTPELESDEAGIAAGDSAIGTLFRYQVEGGEWVEVMFVGDPVWIPSAYLDSLQVKLPANVSGTLNIGVEAGTVDFDEDITRPTSPPDMNGDRADVDIPGVSVGISGKSDLTVIKFDPVADGVTMALNGRATGLEDTAIPLSITTTSTDPSETFEVTISGIPVGSTITYNGVDLTVTGGTVVIPNFENSKSLTVTPPLHYSGDFTLKASAVSKDGDDTSTPTAERDIHVSVKGVADDAEVNLLETPYTVTEGILDANGNQVVLSDLIHSVTTPDTDGSETLTVRITGLGDDFSIVENGDVKLVFQGEGGTERVWLVSADKLDEVLIKLPPNYSGTVDFKVAGVTTEKDGDSNTRELTDVSFTVTPTPEGVITENATLVEDEITPLNLKIIHQNGDTDEVLGDVYIPVNYQDAGGEFTLYLNGVLLEDANLALSEDGDYYIIPSNQVGGLGAKGSEHLDGPLGELEFKYDVTDKFGGSEIGAVTETKNGTLTITATPVTDEIDASINNVTFSNGAVGSTADEVAGDDASPDRVLVTHSGLVTVNLHVDSADTDGSEHLVRVVIEGVPDGVTVVGASEMGGGKWLLIYEGNDAKPIGSGGIDVPVEFIVGQGAGNKVSNITMTVQGQDRGNDSSLAAKIEQDSVSWKLDVNLTDGTTFTPPTIDEWTYNGVEGTEDTSFTLNQVIDAEVSTSDNSQSHSYTITITDLPAGSDVTGMTLSFIDGEPVYTATVIVGPGDSSQDALDELMGQISITPPANWNDNNGDFKFDAKLTASVVGGTSVEKDTEADMPITPVTDEAIVTIDVADVAEGQTSVTATIAAGEGDGGHGVIVDGKLYVQVTTNGNDGGTVSVGGVVVNKTSVSGIADIDDGDYYVIDIGVDGGSVDITYTAPSGSTLQPGDVTFDATVQVKEKDASNIVTTDTSETADVVIINNGVTVESKDWGGLEPNAADKSQAIQLDGLSVVLNDSDGTESITSIMLGGLPVGFLIYVGDTADDAGLADQASNAGGNGTTNTWILSSDGELPPYISILPPANWSGTLDDLKLLVQSGENSLSEKLLESFDLGSLTITPVANGISINPTISFGNEGQVIALNINASMADAAVAESTAPDGSTETTTLEITGLGEFAAFYDGEELLENVSYNKATDTYTITGLTQAQLDKLGFVQAAGSIKDQDDDMAGTQISIKAWTVESDGGAESNAVESDMTVSIAPQLATSGDDVLIWTGAAINGRGGIDMVALRYGESVSNVDLAGKLRNVEGIDLSVGGANSITGGLTLADVLKITGKSNGTLTIDGDGDDSVVLSSEWTAGSTTDTGYIEYTSDSGLKLLIDEDIVTSFI